MSSETIYTPYFYIICHIKSGKMYAGSRWASGCHPDEFMRIDGYTTSSSIVNDIIKEDGVESFNILRIDTNCDGIHPYYYETLFLECLDCANSNNWLNAHNNKFKDIPEFYFGSYKFNSLMHNKYGVSNCMNIEEVKLKQKVAEKKTLMEKYGVDHNMKIPGIAKKASETRIGNWKLSETGRSPLFGKSGDQCASTGVYHNISDEGRKVLSENGKKRKNVPNPKLSLYHKSYGNFITNNPMNDPEKRKKVGMSKLGKRAYINPSISNKRKMYIPGEEPVGYIPVSKHDRFMG